MSENNDNKKKDARETYDFDKDVKYKRQQFAKDDLIDTPYNKAKRYKIASEGVKLKTPEELKAEVKEELKVELREELKQELKAELKEEEQLNISEGRVQEDIPVKSTEK